MPRENHRIVTFLLLAFYLTSCTGKSDKRDNNTLLNKDSISQLSASPIGEVAIEEVNTADSMPVSRNKQIAGTWNALEGEEELTINVTKDSIFYVEHSEGHRYELKRDSIFIHYPDYVLSGKPLLLKDTFAIISDDHTSKFSRTKN